MTIHVEMVGTKELQAALAAAKGRALAEAGRALYLEGEAVMAESKRLVPVDEGTLRNSGMVEPPKVDGSVVEVVLGYGGAGAEYACVAANTTISVQGAKGGGKPASGVRVGDKVLTQAGVWKPVLKVFRYERGEPTPMVRITSRWRKGEHRTLEITPQHEVMVYRDGKNQWVAASEVRAGDQVFRRRKQAHNKGTGAAPEQRGPCKNCGRTWECGWFEVDGKRVVLGQGRVFCSVACRSAYWKAGNCPFTGVPRTAEVRAKMSATMTLRHMFMPEKHPNRVIAGRGQNTDIAQKVAAFLAELGIPYEVNASVGRRHVDFMCRTLKRVIEVDGAYWHRDQAKDVARDKELLAKLGAGWHIVHFHFFDPRFSPELEPEPIPERSFYVSVNPGPATYVEPTAFERAEVVSVESYVWKGHRTGARKLLFDFEVEGVASYTAAGIVVHNCFIHEGTGPAVGRPPFMPPVAPFKEWARRVLGDESLGFVIARAVGRRGLAPRKFLEIPLKARASTMAGRMAARIRRALGA